MPANGQNCFLGHLGNVTPCIVGDMLTIADDPRGRVMNLDQMALHLYQSPQSGCTSLFSYICINGQQNIKVVVLSEDSFFDIKSLWTDNI